MYSDHITEALARQHRAELLGRADRYRLATASSAGTDRRGWRRWISATSRQPAPTHSSATATWSDPVVIRRIDASPSEVAHRIVWDGEPPARLKLAELGELRLDRGGRADPSDADVWHISSRLVGAGPRIARFSRVDIEIRPSSSRAVELRLLPRSRHIHRWATTRHRRYFRLAHAAADRLAELFAA
jgi:hypothetical protein